MSLSIQFKYKTKGKLSVVIVLLMKNTDFMQVLEVQNSKMGKLKAIVYCKLEAVLLDRKSVV